MKTACHPVHVLGALLIAAAIQTANGQGAEAVDQLFPSPAPAAKVAAPPAGEPPAADRLEPLEKRLDAVESRLGPSSRPASVTYNVERRLADLEKRIQQIEQQLARWQQIDQRVRRLEMKQP